MAEDANAPVMKTGQAKNAKGSAKDAKIKNEKEEKKIEKTQEVKKEDKKNATTETQKSQKAQKTVIIESQKLAEAQKDATADSTKTSTKNAEKDKKVKVPEKFKDLVEKIEKMSVLELAELVKVLEDKFGVSAAAPVVAGVAQQAGGAPIGAAEEKSEFNIELKEAGGQKIQVIKAVREITEKGLKEAKDMVDAAPKVIKENVKKEEAEEIKKKLEAAGAKVELK